MKARRAALSLACASMWVLASEPARADDTSLPPLPPVDLASGDLSAETEEADEADDDQDSALDVEDIKDPPARKRAPRRHRKHARIPRARPPFVARPPRLPRVFVVPRHRAAPIQRSFQRPYVLVLRDRAPVEASDRPASMERAPTDEGRAHGGLLVTGGFTRYFGLVPEGAVMPGARLEVATPLPSRWLSSATIGLSGGFDAGTNRGVDAQLWHAGLVLALGAPWTRDFIGVALEGGVLGGHYWDGKNEGIDPRPYGLARLTIQLPLANNVRPFVAGDLGMTERTDDKLAGITGLRAGVVWNAW